MPVQTIDEVIVALDAIIADALSRSSRLGFFATLYREVTVQVKAGIAANRFEDGPRMERLDVLFAKRYLDAYDNFRNGLPTSACWETAFRAAENWRPLILQHLLLGINAHINLDLGIAAAQTAPGAALPALQNDFNRINQILAGLLNEVQAKLGRLSPWLRWFDIIGWRIDELAFKFSLEVARRKAWQVAERFATLSSAEQTQATHVLDAKVTRLARMVLFPGWLFGSIAFWMRLWENNDVRGAITLLRE